MTDELVLSYLGFLMQAPHFLFAASPHPVSCFPLLPSSSRPEVFYLHCCFRSSSSSLFWSGVYSSSLQRGAIILSQAAAADGRTTACANKLSHCWVMQAWLVKDILLHLYSRGKAGWYYGGALFNVLHSDRGGRGPDTHATTPKSFQKWCRVSAVAGGVHAQIPASLHVPFAAALQPCQHCRDGRADWVSVSPLLSICSNFYRLIHLT